MYQGLKSPQNARVLYLDFNSFFASVEQQNNPALRGKPLAVVSHIGPAGTALAASYEAKKLGIRTGTRLRDAWALCPDLLTVQVGLSSYKAVHKKFMAILQDMCGPEVRACSIDEAVIPLSSNWYGSESAHTLALAIKTRFREELGECIKCSIGIAPNGFLGKLATDIRKPDGLLEITLENTTEILQDLDLTDLCGIARRMAVRLNTWQINSPLDLYHSSPEILRQQFGIWGQQWWWRLHGYEPDNGTGDLKSMSTQHALTKWTHDTLSLEPTLDRMTDRLIHRLRRNKFQCRQVGIFLSIKGGRSLSVEDTLDASTQSYTVLWDRIHQLFHDLPLITEGQIRLLGVYFNRLIPSENGYQLDLFQQTERSESVSKAVESVRSRHGFQAIQRGSVIRLDPIIAKEKLGFGQIKDL